MLSIDCCCGPDFFGFFARWMEGNDQFAKSTVDNRHAGYFRGASPTALMGEDHDNGIV